MPRVERIWKRHVHLDFHTSEAIDNIGGAFSRENFQAALRAANLDGITVFAKCHHSWCYYPTAVGMPHPHLQIDLLGEQIAAAHELGVKAPIYVTVGWSANDADMHPEWRQLKADGTPLTTTYDLNAGPETPKPGFSWIMLCPSGSYKDHIVALTAEICERYAVDGIFYDICAHPPCYCANCRAGMAAEGLDADNPADAQRYNVLRWTRLMDACNEVLFAAHPEATVFYNGNAGLQTPQAILDEHTHFELEDLPTTWGGYDKFPLRAKYFAKQGKPRIAMSGKFHTAWGEFGGFKHPDAIRFEAACMVAFGASASMGDQVHPDGEMELATYENLGPANRYLEQIEAYGPDDSVSAATLGLWLSGSEPHDQGVANMLLETQTDFDVLLPGEDLSAYETIILTGGRVLDAASAERLNDYLADGGSLLVLGEGALDAAGERFLLDVGAEYEGPGRFDLDYLVAGDLLSEELPDSPFLCYEPALRCKVTDGEPLAAIHEPYFSRTYGHYCSHQNTPNRREPADHPGAVRKGQVIFLPHALGKLYHAHGARVHRQFVLNALRELHRHPAMTVDMPSGGRVNLLHQPAHRRYVAHLLYALPTPRGRCQVIEDLVPLRDVALTLSVPEGIHRVTLAPQDIALPFAESYGAIRLTVPEVTAHQAVVFEY